MTEPHPLLDPRPVTPLTGVVDAIVDLPGSKSLTNRALVAAALASGTSRIRRALVAEDTRAMLGAVEALGAVVVVEEEEDGAPAEVTVTGVDGRPAPGPLTIDAAKAGTVGRFLPPVLALGTGTYRLDGSEQLRSRPLGPLVEGLRALGVAVDEEGEPGHLPISVLGADGNRAGGKVAIQADGSSQFLSGLMLSAPYFRAGLRIEITTDLVSRPYVVMTGHVMEAFGAVAEVGDGWVVVPPGRYRATDYEVEPDASAASYVLAAAAITGGRVVVPGLGIGSAQGDLGFVDLLARMGATVTVGPSRTEVVGGPELVGIDADLRDLSDTVPTLAVVAAFASTPTRIRGVGFIRNKESDRIGAVVRELRRCGVDAVEEQDGMTITPSRAGLRGVTVTTYDDHRIAMAFSILGLRVPGIAIADPGCVAKTFPLWFDVLDGLGGRA